MRQLLISIVLVAVFASPITAQEIKLSWDTHPSLRAGKWLRLDFRARVQTDMRRSEAGSASDASNLGDVARRRVGVEGRVAHTVDFQAEYELGDRAWRDAYVNYRQFKILQIQAGQFKLPFGLDETTSATNLDFIYRSRISSRLAPGRDRGAAAHGSVFRGIVLYDAGVFKNDGDNARPSAASARVFGNRTTVARVIIVPFHRSKSPLADFQVGAAISGTHISLGLSAIHARTVFGDSFFDSHVWVKGHRQRTGIDVRWRPGPLSLQAEFIRLSDERRGQSVEDGDLPPLGAQGWYLSGTYAITGENKTSGLTRPRHRVGAFEAAARIETLSFGSTTAGQDASTSRRAETILGNADRALTWGMNWYLNPWVKVQVNLIREWIREPSMGPFPSRSSFWSRALRLQLAL